MTYFSRYVEDHWQWLTVEDGPSHRCSRCLEEKTELLVILSIWMLALEKLTISVNTL